MKKLERRFTTEIELRAEGEGKLPHIVGYAAVFNVRSEPIFDFVEVIQPGAFKRSLAGGADVRALVEHDPGRIIGRRSAGTLTLSEDDRGLKFDITPPDTQVGRDIVTSIDRGDIDGASFGFRVAPGGSEWRTEQEITVRTLSDVDVFDVSPVAFPAYPATSTGLRSEFGLNPLDIDIDLLASSLLRLQNGLDLTEEQRSIIAQVRRAIGTVPAETPGNPQQETRSDDSGVPFEILRKRLRLLELQQ